MGCSVDGVRVFLCWGGVCMVMVMVMRGPDGGNNSYTHRSLKY